MTKADDVGNLFRRRIARSERFWQAGHPPRYAAFNLSSSPGFLHSSTRQRAGLTSFPRRLPSGSARSTSGQRSPCGAASSPSRGPSGVSPGCNSARRTTTALPVVRHLWSLRSSGPTPPRYTGPAEQRRRGYPADTRRSGALRGRAVRAKTAWPRGLTVHAPKTAPAKLTRSSSSVIHSAMVLESF